MFNVNHILQSGGLLAIAAIVFAESGMMVGFFLPGDTLLLSAGVFAAQGHFSLLLVILVVAGAAILGDNAGYSIGRVVGPKIFTKKDGIIFRQEYVQKTKAFYERYGSKTMLLAHFVPLVRSFAPLVAGVAQMPRHKFMLFNAIGDAAWATIVCFIGYWFGSKIPHLDKFITPIILAVIVLSISPVVYHVIKDKEARQLLKAKVRRKKRAPVNAKIAAAEKTES